MGDRRADGWWGGCAVGPRDRRGGRWLGRGIGGPGRGGRGGAAGPRERRADRWWGRGSGGPRRLGRRVAAGAREVGEGSTAGARWARAAGRPGCDRSTLVRS